MVLCGRNSLEALQGADDRMVATEVHFKTGYHPTSIDVALYLFEFL